MMDDETTLYRAFDTDGQLLYVGIAARWVQRWSQHAHKSAFFASVARLELEAHPTRTAALEAERQAIAAEHPLHNVVHNRGRTIPMDATTATPSVGDRLWSFSTMRGFEHIDRLWLYPELDCSSCIDDHWSEDGESQLDYYLQYLKRRHPQWLESDAVPISWFVRGFNTIEAAPFQAVSSETFLSFFTWPHAVDNGEPLDWFRMPVRNCRFPSFADALGWTPSPLQPTAPLASIIRSRRGQRSPGQTYGRRAS